MSALLNTASTGGACSRHAFSNLWFIEGPITDGDGLLDPCGDSDGDGIPSGMEDKHEVLYGDVDGDGMGAAEDTDSDGDGATDAREGTADPDANGVPAYVDPSEVVGLDGSWSCSVVATDGDTGSNETQSASVAVP